MLNFTNMTAQVHNLVPLRLYPDLNKTHVHNFRLQSTTKKDLTWIDYTIRLCPKPHGRI